ncbi:cystathionine gamma-lyase cys3 [Podospora bellae-mahoneyi]|uniref:Cystathionine gamma-lyase cys3 n=1 Tax=Podospora bellae-mahoneyi TaxID=2093777 RepID=A0ABR0FAS8_9PEZI|nr:cystathionine gamma-lyase cys3 [Podospora bellae-mahoneyi]
MAYSSARRGVNVTQYLRELNQDGGVVEETLITDEDLAKDLALFTNTQFFDFETGQNTDYQAPPVKPDTLQTSPTEELTSADSIMGDFGFSDFSIPGDYSFGDFGSNYTSPTVPAFPDNLGNLQPIQPTPQSSYAPPVPQQHQPGPPNRILSFEDASRMAAEEDKRRRNTAASARFRIKKKQREQALEKSAKEMTEKVTMLEGRISALETENKWLKSLVTEKHGDKQDILEKFFKEFAAREAKKGSSSSGIKDSISAASSATAVDDSDKSPAKRKD